MLVLSEGLGLGLGFGLGLWFEGQGFSFRMLVLSEGVSTGRLLCASVLLSRLLSTVRPSGLSIAISCLMPPPAPHTQCTGVSVHELNACTHARMHALCEPLWPPHALRKSRRLVAPRNVTLSSSSSELSSESDDEQLALTSC